MLRRPVSGYVTRLVDGQAEELVVGRLAGDPGGSTSGYCEASLKSISPAWLTPTCPIRPASTCGSGRGRGEDGEFVLELQRRPVHQVHALATVDDQRAAVVVAEFDLGAVAAPGAGVPGRQQPVHDVRVVQDRAQPRDPATAVAVGEEDEREDAVAAGRRSAYGV